MGCNVTNDVLQMGERCLKENLYQYLKTVKMCLCVLAGFWHREGE